MFSLTGIYKTFKKTTVTIVLVTSTWLVLTAALKKDIGNLSDWISSLSTFLTLIVAYKAYKAAPNWLNQKLDEGALTQATQIISRDLYQYRKLIERPYDEISCFVLLKDLANEDEDFFHIPMISFKDIIHWKV